MARYSAVCHIHGSQISKMRNRGEGRDRVRRVRFAHRLTVVAQAFEDGVGDVNFD